jgi:hypothetical protein
LLVSQEKEEEEEGQPQPLQQQQQQQQQQDKGSVVRPHELPMQDVPSPEMRAETGMYASPRLQQAQERRATNAAVAIQSQLRGYAQRRRFAAARRAAEPLPGAAAAVSHSCTCIGSPCLRHCVHGASIRWLRRMVDWERG